jgi:hypothetical protein
VSAEPLILTVLQTPECIKSLSLPQWDLLIRQARRANLLARLGNILNSQDLSTFIPTQPRQHLNWAVIVSSRHTQAVRAEIGYIQKALGDLPIILLKGGAYVMAKLPNAAGRLFSDIDILVPKERIGEAESKLMVHGWITNHHDDYDQHYYRNWMHEIPPLQHLSRQSVLDVHHTILPLTMKVRPNADKLRAAATLLPEQNGLMILAPSDMLLHSAAHLFYEGELQHGLRDLVDLDNLLRHLSSHTDFWNTLVSRAQEMELTRCLFYCLRYTALLLGTPIPSKVQLEANVGRPDKLVLKLMDALYLRALLPEHRSCMDRYTGVARKALYIRANALRMPPFMLFRHLFHKALLSKKED